MYRKEQIIFQIQCKYFWIAYKFEISPLGTLYNKCVYMYTGQLYVKRTPEKLK